MQIMHDSTSTQIKNILPDATVAGAMALPIFHVRQGMCDADTLPQLCTSLRRLLAFPQLLQHGFIGMDADADVFPVMPVGQNVHHHGFCPQQLLAV
jgi:hypothetical protein